MTQPPNHYLRQSGASIIEFMIYAGLLGVMMLVIFQLFALVAFGRLAVVNESAIYTNSQRIVSDITRELKSADDITQPALHQSFSSLSIDNGQVIYRLADTRLEKVVDGTADFLTGTDVAVSDLLFTHLGPSATQSSVLVSFSLENTTTQTVSRSQSFQIGVTQR